MRYRIAITRTDGEQRQIDYTTRSAAFGHFSSVALSRNTAAASVMKQIDGPALGHPTWDEIAHMEVIRQAMPVPQEMAQEARF